MGLLLAPIGAAVVSEQKHARAIAQRVMEHTQVLSEELIVPDRNLPSESTLRRGLFLVNTERMTYAVTNLGPQRAGQAKMEGLWRGTRDREPSASPPGRDSGRCRGAVAHREYPAGDDGDQERPQRPPA